LRIAAIDAGTNTTRLLVAETQGSSYRSLDRRLVFTRLGEGVDASGSLAAAGIKRTLGAIAEFCSVCGDFEVQKLTIGATSAVRDAGNGKEFLEAARKLSGGSARAITGDEEARLSFLGATSDLRAERVLVFDIGGGSTEFVVGTPGEPVAGWVSLDIGAVRLTERYLRSDPPATEEMLLLESAIDDALTAVDNHLEGCAGALLVGLGGTVTTLAALHLGLEVYDPDAVHHHSLPQEALNSLYHSLAEISLSERIRPPILPAGRADVAVAGSAIASRILARWGFDRVVVSEKDILDGLVLELIGAVA
jgi:exopolyphosphatase/guanosine-5'-triphosphate,3'-diphosphate pyrophosphatase